MATKRRLDDNEPDQETASEYVEFYEKWINLQQEMKKLKPGTKKLRKIQEEISYWQFFLQSLIDSRFKCPKTYDFITAYKISKRVVENENRYKRVNIAPSSICADNNFKEEGKKVNVNFPFGSRGLPLALLCDVFSDLKNDLQENLNETQFSKEIIDFTIKFLSTVGVLYNKEDDLNNAVRDIFSSFFKTKFERTFSGDQSISSDGHILKSKSKADNLDTMIFVYEGKVRDTSSRANPALQASLYYEFAVVDFLTKLEKDKNILKNVDEYFPCILFVVDGDKVSLYGAIAPGSQVSIEWFGTWCSDISIDDTESIYAFARMFSAVEKAFKKLNQELNESTSVANSEFPFPDKLSNGQVVKYNRFIKINENDSLKFVLVGKLDDHDVVVKFARKYCKELHDFCANKNCAPKLIDYQELRDGWKMIVMERMIDYEMAVNQSNYKRIYPKLNEIVSEFHESDFVHGDLRGNNILVKEDEFKIIDFDFGGKIGEAFYPITLNMGINWAPCVDRLKFIQKDHDLHEINKFN